MRRDALAPYPRFARAQRLTWLLIILIAIMDAGLLAFSGLHLTPVTLPVASAIFTGLFLLAAYYRYWRDEPLIAGSLTSVNQVIAGSLLLAGLSYLGAWLVFPLQDAALIHLDQSLPFSWKDYLLFINAHPSLARVYEVCYAFTGMEIPLLLLLLFLARSPLALQRFVSGFLTAGVVVVVIATFWPSRVAFDVFSMTPKAYPHIHIAEALTYLRDYDALRSHSLTVLPDRFEGIVQFPSFHSALAVLGMEAALAFPGWVGLPLILVNGIMLLATPVQGGHYFVDTIAGTLIGLLVVWGCRRMIPFEKNMKAR